MNLSNENVVHIQKDGIEYLQFRRLLEYKHRINHAYSLGINKNYMTNQPNKDKLNHSTYQKVIKKKKKLCQSIDSRLEHLVKANQEHTNHIKVVKEKINKDAPDFNLKQYDKIDGLVTNQKDIMLSTTNADCILLLF